MLFEAEFAKEIEKQLAIKQSNKDKTLIEKMGKQTKDESRMQRFEVANDDEHKTLMWRALMKDSAYYFDVPSIQEEKAMRKNLQRKYDSLFQPGWRPALQSRRDLVTWSCGQFNKSLEAREIPAEQHVDCENYSMLLTEFGPNYDLLRPKLGHIKGLFD